MQGNIHSIETFGTVDGPGIRYVVFFQGCPMRCLYCHNPDTWEPALGSPKGVGEILDDYERYKPFLKNGGLTVTGGEPLMQTEFLIELFEAAKERGIHTCLDTSGIVFSDKIPSLLLKFHRLIKSTDLVMLDIKHIDEAVHLKLTGHSNRNILAFAHYLELHDIPVWIRHVVVPSLTDDASHLKELGRFIGALKNVKALDILPYHDMARVKYEKLCMAYPLDNIKPATKEDAARAKALILEGIREVS